MRQSYTYIVELWIKVNIKSIKNCDKISSSIISNNRVLVKQNNNEK